MQRNFVNTALPLSLANPSGLSANGADNIVQVPSTAGYPSAPFLLGLERGTSREEVCLVTGLTSTSFTVTRGYDGTIPQVHAQNTPVEHVAAAIDYREANTHINDVTRNDHPQYVLGSILSIKGALFVYDGTNIVSLTPGVNGTFLTADNTQPSGYSFTTPFISGMIIEWSGVSAPTGFLLCDGSLYDRATFATLFAVIGTRYMTSADVTAFAPGSSGGGTNGKFRVPDYRGRVPMGAGQGTGLANRTLGQGNSAAFGEETHLILEGELPLHDHQAGSLATSNTGGHDHGFGGGTIWNPGGNFALPIRPSTGSLNEAVVLTSAGGASGVNLNGDYGSQITWSFLSTDGIHTHTLSGNTGTGTWAQNVSHNNIQPSIVVNFIIRF